MDETDFQISAEEYRDCRLVRVVFPTVITMQRVSADLSKYLTLLDTELPVVIVNDVRNLSALSNDARAILIALIRRNATQTRFLGSVWMYGTNTAMREPLRDMIEEGGRDPESAVDTEEHAFAYLDELIDLGQS
jgi:hypothetical protein